MKKIMIAPVSENMESLYIGLREFPTEKMILLCHSKHLKNAEQTKSELEKFKIPTSVIKIDGNIWDEVFKKIYEIKNNENENNLIINVSTGDNKMQNIIISAAFVNGIQAFLADNNEIISLPILKYSYYKMLTGKKLELLTLVYNGQNGIATVEDLSKKLKMSAPLLSYHINGNLKSEGLKELGLLETEEIKGKLQIKITPLGKLLIKGCLH